jgi:hypothetical protein
MCHRRFHDVTVIIAILLLAAFGQSLVFAGSVIYHVTVDTSALNGESGYVDFQFNPGDSSAETATATITDFHTVGGSLVGSAILTGDASGMLPGALTLDNGSAFNDVFQGFTYGSEFSLDVMLSGKALDDPGGTVGSSFALALYAADGFTPLLTTDPNGSVVTINVNADGTTTSETFPQSPTNSTPAAVATSAVPEPSSCILCACAMALISAVATVRARNPK